MNKLPSERIKDLYFDARGKSFDDPQLWINCILAYLDEQAEKPKEDVTTGTLTPNVTLCKDCLGSTWNCPKHTPKGITTN